MLENLVDSLAKRFKIDHALARQTLAMMLQGSEGHLASELEDAIGGLGDVEAAGSGGGGFGLMGEASGLVSGTPQSGLHGLKALLGADRIENFDQTLSDVVGEQAGPELGGRLRVALARLSQ